MSVHINVENGSYGGFPRTWHGKLVKSIQFVSISFFTYFESWISKKNLQFQIINVKSYHKSYHKFFFPDLTSAWCTYHNHSERIDRSCSRYRRIENYGRSHCTNHWYWSLPYFISNFLSPHWYLYLVPYLFPNFLFLYIYIYKSLVENTPFWSYWKLLFFW